MDAYRASRFILNLNLFPVDPLKPDEVAREVAQFFGALFSIVMIQKPHPLLLMSSLKQENLSAFDQSLVEEQRALLIKFFSGSLGEMDNFRVYSDQESSFFLQFRSLTGFKKNLAVIRLGGGGDHSSPESWGWIVLGLEGHLSSEQEFYFSSLAIHFFDLIQAQLTQVQLQLRTQFLSIASHELKTPLTSIYGMLQLQERLLRSKMSGNKVEIEFDEPGFLKKVIRQVEKLNQLIDHLLDLSRIQAGRFGVDPTWTNLSELIGECIQNRFAVIQKEAEVSFSLDLGESIRAWVDPVRTEEVITNLVMNAIRFSPEGGVIWVKLKEDSDWLRISVRDQGPSIAPEDWERIFRPYERAQRTSRLGGLGLGLFISKEIALLHGGDVSLIESIPGKGNVFEARFPVKKMLSQSG